MDAPSKRFLILAVTAGHGHLSVADAIAEELRAAGAAADVVEAVDAVHPVIGELHRVGNEAFVRGFPGLYRGLYVAGERKRPSPEETEATLPLLGLFADRLLATIARHPYDAVVCTMIFSAQMASLLKRRGCLPLPVIGVVTDYTIHPFWEDAVGLDRLVTASPLLTHQAVRRGLGQERILPFGIPVGRRFRSRQDAAEARRALGLDPARTTVLVMGGGEGFVAADRIIRSLEEVPLDLQVLAVAGSNRALRRRLERLETRVPTKVFGFTDRMDLLMDAADAAVTKPGGVTVAECLAKGLPMVLVSPIPGQEERNREFLLNHGLAMAASRTCPVDETLLQLLSDPARIPLMRRAMREYARPDAAKDLADCLLAGCPNVR